MAPISQLAMKPITIPIGGKSLGKPKRKLSAHNKCMSRELKGNLSGKTKAQREKIFSAAARKCSRETKKTSTSSKPKSRASPSRANPTGGTRRMGNSFNMNKIYGIIRKVAVFVPAADLVMNASLGNQDKVKYGIMWYFGWDPWSHKFRWEQLWKGWGPAVGAQVITRVIPAINKIIRSFL